MTTDELQKLASIVRWIGWGIVVIGACVSFFSHFIADMIVATGRADKAKAEKRFTATEDVLAETKAKTTTHEEILSYRTVTAVQQQAFMDEIKDAPKGAVKVWAVTSNDEAFQYAKAISTMLAECGYPTGKVVNSWMSATPQQGVVAAVATQDSLSDYRSSLVAALIKADIDLTPIIGHPAATNQPEFIHIIVGSKAR